MCASAVVVQEAPETSRWRPGSNWYSLMPLMSITASSGVAASFCLLLKGELCTTTFAPASK